MKDQKPGVGNIDFPITVQVIRKIIGTRLDLGDKEREVAPINAPVAVEITENSTRTAYILRLISEPISVVKASLDSPQFVEPYHELRARRNVKTVVRQIQITQVQPIKALRNAPAQLIVAEVQPIRPA